MGLNVVFDGSWWIDSSLVLMESGERQRQRERDGVLRAALASVINAAAGGLSLGRRISIFEGECSL
jgi:hypothetical protein